MALGDPYITRAELKSYLGIPAGDTDDDTRVDTAVAGARAEVERFCHRQFNDAGSATARYFSVRNRRKAIVDDFSTDTGLVVKVGSISGGFTTTWTQDTDFFIGPINTTRNENSETAYWRIQTMVGQRFPYLYGEEPNLEVTARWGWSTVPDSVIEASYILGARLFRRADSPDGVLGSFEGAPVRVGWRMDPDAERALIDYRKYVPL